MQNMTKDEFNNEIDNYTYRGFTIDDEVIIGDKYFIKELTPSLIQVGMRDEKEKRGILYNSLEKVSNTSLGYYNGLEMLFNHYPFGPSNDSNCFLCNLSGQVLGVSYNGVKRNKVIICDGKKLKPYMVLNKYYKIDGDYTIDDLDIIISRIKKI